MPVYHYQALEGGKKRKGFIEAASLEDAKQKLREQNILITSLTTTSTLSKKQNLSSIQLLSFTTMLNQLVSANIPLYESLVAVEEQMRGEPYHRVILSLTEQVKAGSRLSEAMKSFPMSFNKLYTSMIGAGEAAGALKTVLMRLAQFLEKQAKLKKQIANALIYPAILACFALSVIILLMGFVIPSIEGIFEGRTLNAYTEFVLSVSRFLRTYWWILLIGIVGLGTWVYYALKKPAVKAWLERQLMRLPVIRNFIIDAALVRFARTLSTLQEGGLPLIEALSLSKEVMQNAPMQEDVQKAEKKILEGGNLSFELKKSRFIPSMAARMIAVGEETGHLSEMFRKIADMYEDSLEKTIERVMSLVQPAILIVMGVIIGLVLLAILLPMTDISALSTP